MDNLVGMRPRASLPRPAARPRRGLPHRLAAASIPALMLALFLVGSWRQTRPQPGAAPDTGRRAVEPANLASSLSSPAPPPTAPARDGWAVLNARIDTLTALNAAQEERIRALTGEVALARARIQSLQASVAMLEQVQADHRRAGAGLNAGAGADTERQLRALLTRPDFLADAFITEEFMDIHDALNLELIQSLHPEVFLRDPLAE